MSQEDFNNNWPQYVLYNVNSIQGSPTVYPTDCSTICSASYDENNNIVLSDWLIGPTYTQPTNATLISYSLNTVIAWYNGFYTWPVSISNSQPFQLTTAQLATVRTDSTMVGMSMYDTTVNAQKYFNGTSWINSTPSQFLYLSGGTMTGDLNMGANAITNASSVKQSAPSAVSIWSSDSVSVTFTSDTPKVISITGFTQTVNPASDFTATTTTGKVQYTGSSTRYFRITVYFSVTRPSVLSTETLTHYISKNSSTTIGGQRSVRTFVVAGSTDTYVDSLSDVVQLATNDTLQLGGQYTVTTSLTYKDVSYAVSQL